MVARPTFTRPALPFGEELPPSPATVTLNITAGHIEQARSEGTHPVALAIRDAMQDTRDVAVIRDGAYVYNDSGAVLLRFARDGIRFTAAWDRTGNGSPVTFEAEVVEP